MFSAKALTPIDRQLSKKVVKIIHGLLMMQQSAAFRKPVPHKALGLQDYKLIVKKPTDLNLIRRQNNEGKYKFVEEILDDIQLCWDNCKLYNAVGSEIYNQALFLEKNFDKLGIQILPDFWDGVSREEYNQKFNEKKLEEQKQKTKRPQIKQSQAIMKNELPILLKEESIKNKNKKQVVYPRHGYDQSEIAQSEHVSRGFEKEKDEMIENQHGYSAHQEHPNAERVSMEAEEEGDEPQHTSVDPIMVNMYRNPTREQLLELSQLVKNVYAKEDFQLLEKILDVLHSNEKENMSLNKNGLMSFKMNNIHISTFYRIKKLVGMAQETSSIIE